MHVFKGLMAMYQCSNRVLGEQEVQFYERMERLLQHDSVRLVMEHAQAYPRMGDKRVMECMVYADASKIKAARNRDRQTSRASEQELGSYRSPGSVSPVALDAEASDESEDEIDKYQHVGQLMTPSGRSAESPTLVDSVSPPHQEKKMVLKKPFFKSWDDFMEFDNGIKHKMPITLSEFDLLLQKEQESQKGWEICVDRKEIKVAKMMPNPTNPIMTLRAWATVRGVDINAAFYQFYNMEQRCSWDKIFAKMELVDPDVQASEVLYSLLKPPAVTARDFLQYRRIKVFEDGSIHIVLRSAEHPNCPENKSYIRAESYIAGYILRQTFEGDEPVLSVFLMSCADVKGLVPKWVINLMAPKKPPEWVDAFRTATLQYQKDNPNFKQKLKEDLKKFMVNHPFDFEEVVDVPAEETHAVAAGTVAAAPILTQPSILQV